MEAGKVDSFLEDLKFLLASDLPGADRMQIGILQSIAGIRNSCFAQVLDEAAKQDWLRNSFCEFLECKAIELKTLHELTLTK